MRAPLRWARGVARASLALAASACSSGSSRRPRRRSPTPGGTLRLAVVGLDSLDPAKVVPTNQADMVAVDLLDRGPHLDRSDHQPAVPALATKWTSDAPTPRSNTHRRGGAAGDGRHHLDVHLDPQARFSDGSAVTAGRRGRVAHRGGQAGQHHAGRRPARRGRPATTTWCRARPTAWSGLRADDGNGRRSPPTAPDAELPLLLALAGLLGDEAGPSRASTTTTDAGGGQHDVALVAPQGSGPFRLAVRRRDDLQARAQRRLGGRSSTRST